MMSWLDNALGLHAQALSLRSRRTELLANNIANSDTPGFKARDFDFNKALNAAMSDSGGSLKSTHANHIAPTRTQSTELLYRVPTQPSTDGNTVQAEVEQAAFAENAVRYQASAQFLDGAISSLMLAIRGQ